MASTVTTRMLVVGFVLLGCAGREAPAPPPATPRSEGGAPVPAVSDGVGCRTDAECGKGHVCVSCDSGGSCVGGCRTSADCSAGEICAQVQCIRCPCPPQCKKG